MFYINHSLYYFNHHGSKSLLENSFFLLMMGFMKKKDILLSLLSGILLILSFPNFDLEFLAWFALVPLLYSIEGKGIVSQFHDSGF